MQALRFFSFILFLFFVATSYAQDVSQNTFFAHTNVIIINAEELWTNTNIDVSVGEDITIIVDGMASHGSGPNPQYQGWTGPEGWGGEINASSYPAPNLSAYCIIGKVGNDGTPFYVGKAVSYKVNKAGRLFLGFNDDNFSNNYGYYIGFIIANKTFTSAALEKNQVIENSNLGQNYPNPFNPSTTIEYQVPKQTTVKINIYDINGQLVKELLNEEKNTGNYSTVWNGKNNAGNTVASGTYFYQIQSGDFIQVKKMILLR